MYILALKYSIYYMYHDLRICRSLLFFSLFKVQNALIVVPFSNRTFVLKYEVLLQICLEIKINLTHPLKKRKPIFLPSTH